MATESMPISVSADGLVDARLPHSVNCCRDSSVIPATWRQAATADAIVDTSALPAMPPEWGHLAVVILATLMGLFIVIGAVGNLLVIAAIAMKKGFKNKSFMFVLNLAITDFCTSVTGMPLAFTTLINGRWIFGEEACQFNAFTTELFFITSLHTLMYMSIYRYIGISRPLKRSRMKWWHVLLMLVAAWTYAVIISALTWQLLNHFLYKPLTTQCGPGFPSDYRGWIDLGVVAVTCFALPVVVIVTMYALIYCRVWRHLGRLQLSSNAERHAYGQQKKLAITFLVVIVTFVVCWMPLMFYIVYISLTKDKASAPALLNPIVYWLSYMNSALNPIIYSMRTPLLRQLLRRSGCLKALQALQSEANLSRLDCG